MTAKPKHPQVQLIRKSPFHILAAALVISGLVGFGYTMTRVFAAGAASLYMVPASGSYNVGSQVAVQVMVNTGGDPTNAVQADFSYPTSRLQFVSIDGTGSAYDIDASSTGGNGTVSIARGKIGQVSGAALVATVHFTVQGTAGSAALSFLGSSAVVRSTDNANILGTTTGATYTVTVPATPTPTPVPTATPVPTHTPTPAPGVTTPKPTTTPKATTTPTPQKSSTPTPVGAPAASNTPAPTVATSTPASVTASASPQSSKTGKVLVSPFQTKVLLGGGSVLLIILGIVLWLGAQRRHQLAVVSGHGSSQPYPPSSSSAPAMTPPPSTPPVTPSQTFYPQDPSANQGNDHEAQQ